MSEVVVFTFCSKLQNQAHITLKLDKPSCGQVVAGQPVNCNHETEQCRESPKCLLNFCKLTTRRGKN